MLVIDPRARTLSFIEGAEEGGLKYFGICAGPDGMLYCAATAASSVLVIDPRTQTLSFIEGAVGSGLKWSGICAGSAGRLYIRPAKSEKLMIGNVYCLLSHARPAVGVGGFIYLYYSI